ncbi:MAG TPA: hypothetical protein VHW47_08770 [Acidimicrobiales bacterium]|jgi:hypothetical protein|nr:hypothetical protein [Acidimicrobiales bacterium]
MAGAAREALAGVCKLTDKSALSTGVRFGGIPAGLSTASDVPLQPGTQQATAQVTMVYALRKAVASRPAKA